MSFRFCCNLNFMFVEAPVLLDRYELAAKAGFKAVECGNPYDYSLNDLIKAKETACVEQILINTPVDVEKKHFGYAALGLPNTKDFLSGLHKSIEYAKALNCSNIHIMSGIVVNPNENNLDSMIHHLNLAKPYLESAGITGLIEPINQHSLPNYYLNNYDTALKIINQVNSTNVKLMLDIFHLQQISGDLTHNITRLLPFAGHIQIAQVPKRNEPDTFGEIDYCYLFKLLKQLGYSKFIGLEYFPQANTVDGLKWIEKFGFKL